MGFSVPEFPSTCDIYTMVDPLDFNTREPRLSSICQLRLYGRLNKYSSGPTPGGNLAAVGSAILLPARTDVRDGSCSHLAPDIIECPAGTGRWYVVSHVDDVARDFPNEYRLAAVDKIFSGVNFPNFPDWPVPIP